MAYPGTVFIGKNTNTVKNLRNIWLYLLAQRLDTWNDASRIVQIVKHSYSDFDLHDKVSIDTCAQYLRWLSFRILQFLCNLHRLALDTFLQFHSALTQQPIMNKILKGNDHNAMGYLFNAIALLIRQF